MDQLRPYQEADAQFLAARDRAALFNEQRTGKTPTVLRALQLKGCRKVLIVCPASVMVQWSDEYSRWLKQPCLVCAGTRAHRRRVIQSWTHGMVISYDTLRGQVINTPDLDEILQAHADALVMDEAHRIRNRKTRTTNSIFRLTQIPVRYLLTGTPVLNRAHEIWPLLHVMYPHTFKSYWPFINQYFYTYKEMNKAGGTYIDIGATKPEGEAMLQKVLPRISMMRKRQDVMTWLPDKEYISIGLEPNAQQQKYLDELETIWETEHIITIGVLDRLIRYRQICLDPLLLDLEGGSPKTEWLLQYLQDYPDRPLLVFSKFTSYLLRLSGLLDHIDHALIIGATEVQRRKEASQLFQSGKINLLLLNIDAGKEGLTLDRAEAVVFMDRYPPVGDLAQAEDRFVATTEARADKDHLVYFLYLKGTYDEEINQLIADRVTETDVINNYQRYMERRKANGNRRKV